MLILFANPELINQLNDLETGATHEQIENICDGWNWEVVRLSGYFTPDEICDLLYLVYEHKDYCHIDKDLPYYSYFVEE